MLNIVLVEPEIPQNTGNIVRTAAATGARVHLVKPLGFDISDKAVKRAGLDYWHFVDIVTYENLEEFFEKNKGAEFWYASTKAQKRYDEVPYSEDCYILFGKETKGLPEDLLHDDYQHAFRIPMIEGARSLNLSNSVAIVAYEMMRHHDFSHLQQNGKLTKY